jgi:hypothetical protein
MVVTLLALTNVPIFAPFQNKLSLFRVLKQFCHREIRGRANTRERHFKFVSMYGLNPRPMKSLKIYTAKTSPLRTLNNTKILFIGTTKNPVINSNIGRWIKEQLKQVAAGSKPVAAVNQIQAILKQGQCARESIFAKFYKHEVSTSIAAAVLNSLDGGEILL